MKCVCAFRLPATVLAACLFLMGCPLGGPAGLVVSPIAVSFTPTRPEATISIRNRGSNLLSWVIENDVPWLTASTTAGTTLKEVDYVRLTANAGGLPPSTYPRSIRIVSNAGSQTVAVALVVPGTPVMQVVPPVLNLLGDQESTTFVIRNTGTARLTWNISFLDPAGGAGTIPFPDYIEVSPQHGSTDIGGETTVTVGVDRLELDPGMYSFTLRITSDGGNVDVPLNMAVGLSAKIGVEPAILDFGQTLNQLTLDVYNQGYPGSILNFTVSTDRPDMLFFDPPGGTSVAPPAHFVSYDRVTIAVTLDRSAVRGELDSGKIIISAPGIQSVEVLANVERAPLMFEGAMNRTRPPFILRFVFLVRDSLGRALNTRDPAVLEDLRFSIEEDGVPLDEDETSVFVTSAQNLRYNLVLLLDFTGSMYNAGSGGGTAIQQMVSAARNFILDLPASYRVAVMEYHERQQTNRLIHGFSTARAPILSALDAFSLPPADHGASEMYDAVMDGCVRLANEDIGVLPFDDTDVRALVFISDGRDTSSLSTLDQVITFAQDNRVRLYPIGFGNRVNAGPLVQMAIETGGHFYRAPSATDLVNLLEHEVAGSPGAPGVIVEELSRQIVLTYISLFQDGGHNYLVRGQYGDIQGQFESDAVLAVGGDVRAGQIGLYTNGIQPGGGAEVIVRTEYVPRNISQFRLRFYTTPATPFTVELAPEGIIKDWILVEESPGVYTALTLEDNPLRYGSFGDLLRLTFTGLVGPVLLDCRVDNRIYLNPPVTKFFQYPDTLAVGVGSSQATVVPLLLSSGFDPDAPDAWDRDGDTVPDFDDRFPSNPGAS